MYGLVIAFKYFAPAKGILGSPWAGVYWFREFFNSYFIERLIKNTLLINVLNLLFSFPAPIILALLLNELRSERYKRSVQTITYLPHFISLVVICGMIHDFTSRDGIINDLVVFFGGERSTMLLNPGLFRPIYIAPRSGRGVAGVRSSYLAACPA